MAEAADVVVVGGGLAGIAAALELQAQGRKVLVLERAAVLGGKLGTQHTEHGHFPTGPTSFNGRHAVFWKLLGHLGLDGEARRLSPASGARYVVRGGGLRALKPNPISVLSTSALSFGDKVKLATDFFSRRKGAPGVEEDESLDTFLERRFGRELVDHFFAAVLSGIFAGDLKRLSAASCMPALVTAEKEYGSVLRGALKALRQSEDGSRPGLYTFEAGMGRIAEVAAEKLTWRGQVAVERLRPEGAGVRVEGTWKGAPLAVDASRVVLATEAAPAAELLSAWLPQASAVLKQLPYAPVALVHWADPEGVSKLPLGFGYLTPPVEQCFALGTLFVGDLLAEPNRRFSTFVGGAMFPERAGLDDQAMAAGVDGDLKKLTGGALGKLAAVTRWSAGVFQPPVGHARLLAALDQAMAGQPVALAGSYRGGAAMKDALAAGFAAAGQVLAGAPGVVRPDVPLTREVTA